MKKTAHKIESFMDQLGHRFQNPQYLEQALCHRSASAQHNERLEFLGDAVLGMVVSDLLYQRYPRQTEGVLSRLRSVLVNKNTLHEISQYLNIQSVLTLGPGESIDPARERRALFANAVEALVGAVYLDGGLQSVQKLIIQWMGPRLPDDPKMMSQKDAKSLVQEWAQANHHTVPVYVAQYNQGRFRVLCTISGLQIQGKGIGTTRKQGEQDAAQDLLNALKKIQ